MKQRAVFLDRDGVLNVERGDYTWRPEDFEVCAGVPKALRQLKQAGYLLIVVTNQGGIAKGLYTKADMDDCHQKLHQACPGLIDAIYYAPGHPAVSASLSRKPDSLMLERATAKFDLDLSQCWMVGDTLRDIEAAAKVGVRAIKVGEKCEGAVCACVDLREAVEVILSEPRM